MYGNILQLIKGQAKELMSHGVSLLHQCECTVCDVLFLFCPSELSIRRRTLGYTYFFCPVPPRE